MAEKIEMNEDSGFRSFMYDREGRAIVCTSPEQVDQLVSEGCVDNPAKIGLNVWGEGSEDDVQKIKHDFDAGRLKPVDDIDIRSDRMQSIEDENVALQQQLADMDKKYREQETLLQLYKQAQEEQADDDSDAGLTKDGAGTQRSPKPKPETEPKPETKPKAETPKDPPKPRGRKPEAKPKEEAGESELL